jgi:site-specific recombinase XerD
MNVTKQPPIKKNILTDEEIAKLRDCCNRPIEIALLDFLLSTGVRVGELTSIKLSDVDFMNKSVKVFATKTNQERVVYLKADAMKHIVDYRNSLNQSKIKNDYLFLSRTYTKLSSESVEYILHQLELRAGINKRITVHVFRKTLASNLFRMGSSPATIASILGHKDFSTTSKFYCSIDTDNIKSEFFKYMK